MRIKTALSIFILIAMGCGINKNIKTIQRRNVDVRLNFENGIDTFYYRNKLMDGTYKFKHGLSRNYVIENFKAGLRHGSRKQYKKGQLYIYEESLNGLQNGKTIWYKNKRKELSFSYKNGFPVGEHIVFAENGKDTLRNIIYEGTPYKMDVYVDNYSDVIGNSAFDLMMIIGPYLIKADEYPQRYYLKCDSTLVYESIWHRINSYFHTNIKYDY